MSAQPEYADSMPTPKRISARAPSNILEMRGSGKRSEHRAKRANSPDTNPQKLEPLGPPPKYFSKEEVATWNEVVDLACKGVLTKNDRIIVECLSSLLVVARKTRWVMPANQIARIERCLALLGMTPAHRSHVRVVFPDEPPNPYG